MGFALCLPNPGLLSFEKTKTRTSTLSWFGEGNTAASQ
jgi:hypothetical protein